MAKDGADTGLSSCRVPQQGWGAGERGFPPEKAPMTCCRHRSPRTRNTCPGLGLLGTAAPSQVWEGGNGQ